MPMELNQIITTTAPDKSTVVLSNAPTIWYPIDPAKTLFVSPIHTTHTFPVNLTNQDDITRNEEWIASRTRGIGVPNGFAAVYNKIAPKGVCPVHRTETIDFGVIVQGELELVFPDEKDNLRLKRGDVFVQRGTSHGWVNPSEDEDCILFITINAAKPVEINGEELKKDLSALGM